MLLYKLIFCQTKYIINKMLKNNDPNISDMIMDYLMVQCNDGEKVLEEFTEKCDNCSEYTRHYIYCDCDKPFCDRCFHNFHYDCEIRFQSDNETDTDNTQESL